MSRLRCLQDFAAEGLDAMVECLGCGRRVRADPRKLFDGLRIKWPHNLAQQQSRMRCGACGHRGARLAPVPKIIGPLDCDEFRTDIEAMWERVMAEDLTGQCNAEIAEPDGDGLVYVVSTSDRSVKMACLGTEEEAMELMSQWLAAHDHDEPTL